VYFASLYGAESCQSFLIGCGADAATVAKNGNGFLYIAWSLIMIGETCMHAAARSGHVACVQCLVSKGLSVNDWYCAVIHC